MQSTRRVCRQSLRNLARRPLWVGDGAVIASKLSGHHVCLGVSQARGHGGTAGQVSNRGFRSPHSVLGVALYAPRSEIKARFRELAKQYHPDISEAAGASGKMAELVEAYDALMDDDLGGRISANPAAWSLEVYTVDELRASGIYDVHTLRLILLECDLLPDASNASQEVLPGDSTLRQTCGTSSSDASVDALKIVPSSGESPAVPVVASLDDSVLDLKRALQHEHSLRWGLADRLQDRHGLAMGWELVFDGSALSYHLFLHDYGMTHGDLLYAVVRRAKA